MSWACLVGAHRYESHEAKRELCKLYDLFLADERVLPMLPKLIGKSFFKKKKQPIPVDLTAKDFPAQVTTSDTVHTIATQPAAAVGWPCQHTCACLPCPLVGCQVSKACGATYLYKTSGTCVNLRVARSSFDAGAIVQNVYAALVQAVEHLPKKWSNVQVRRLCLCRRCASGS